VVVGVRLHPDQVVECGDLFASALVVGPPRLQPGGPLEPCQTAGDVEDAAADVLDRMEPDELRRTRIAQVAGAFWREGDGFTLVCFRSVAGYVMGLLTHSAQPGSELG